MRAVGVLAGGLVLLAIGVALILSLVSIEIGLVLSVLSAIPLGFAASRSFRRP